jgi:hypothetical protein
VTREAWNGGLFGINFAFALDGLSNGNLLLVAWCIMVMSWIYVTWKPNDPEEAE